MRKLPRPEPIPKERNIRRRQILESGRSIVTISIQAPGTDNRVVKRIINLADPLALERALVSVIEGVTYKNEETA